MLRSYLQLRERTDRFFESVAARYNDQVLCTAGCSACCESGISIVIIEAVAMGKELGISEDRIQLQAGQASIIGEGSKCSFLDEKGYCKVYVARPLICRTHGMPLLNIEDETVNVCELNFKDIEPHRSTILNTENLNAALFAVNLEYCTKNGLNPRARVSIDRVAQLSGISVEFSNQNP
ncbi:MAG: YkgJ family cysteine cluster protein [Deltaproteobacteria bacterium]|nr:YkgJ family cysteine cluster protein [Deltaproteobacteria bacterium]